jgi:bifunctional DNA-binding transcriptional regulator/antitoxin component of YhaV-PrlF toxin-antitoxin module
MNRVVSPVIPPPIAGRRDAGHARPDRRPAAALPLANPPPPLPVATGVLYGMGSVDSSGRVCNRAITTALDWRPGDRLTMTADTGHITARRDPTGMIILPHKPASILIPAALRHRCGITTGDRVLLSANRDRDVLVMYPMGAVHHALIDRYHTEKGAPPDDGQP